MSKALPTPPALPPPSKAGRARRGILSVPEGHEPHPLFVPEGQPAQPGCICQRLAAPLAAASRRGIAQ